MPPPAGVTTFTLANTEEDVTFAPAAAGVRGTLTPVDASGSPVTIVHLASGVEIVPAGVVVTIAADGTWSIPGLPYTDQAGLSVVGFQYRMQWNTARARQYPQDKTFSVPSGTASPVLYSSVTASPTVPTVLVPVGVGPQGPTGPTGATGLTGPPSYPSNVLTKTANYTAAVNDFIQADTSGGGFTITLPAAPVTGSLVAVKKITADANTVTVVASSSGTIDGDATATTNVQWASVTLEHIGSNVWRVVNASVAGSQGPAGPAGPTGATGATGPAGPAGPSGVPSTIVNRTSAYTASVSDFVQCDTSGGGFTVTLPAAPAVGAPVTTIKVSSDANTLTVAPAAGGSINGDATATATAPWAKATFEHVGSDVWRIV